MNGYPDWLINSTPSIINSTLSRKYDLLSDNTIDDGQTERDTTTNQ